MKSTNFVVALGSLIFGVWAHPRAWPEPTPVTGQTLSLKMFKRAVEEYELPRADLQRRAGTVVASAAVKPIGPNDDKWLVPIKVGDQIFDVVLDTGSSSFWVLGEKLKSSGMVGPSQTIYKPGTTATSVAGMSYTAVFDGGYTAGSGDAYIDKVAIGPATATAMTFGVATSVAATDSGTKSGIIGLSHADYQGGFQQNGQKANPPTFLNQVLDTLASRVFTVDLQSNASAGTLDLGFINRTKITNTISYATRLTSHTNWYINGGSYAINDIQGSAATVDYFHPDTGATYMSFPKAIVDQYYNKMPIWNISGGVRQFPCSYVRDNTLPSFSVYVGGTPFKISPDYMWYQQSVNKTLCRGALQEGGLTINSNGVLKTGAILGDMFLRTVHAVYDFGAPGDQVGRVGFANKPLRTRTLG